MSQLASIVTKQRLRQALDDLDTRYRVDDDGDFLGWWGDDQFMSFTVTGKQSDILHILGRWRPRPPAGLLPVLSAAANTWNTEKMWPKVYVRLVEDQVSVQTELNVDCEGGVTDAFLQQQIKCAVGTTGQFFELLEERYPEFPAWVPQ